MPISTVTIRKPEQLGAATIMVRKPCRRIISSSWATTAIAATTAAFGAIVNLNDVRGKAFLIYWSWDGADRWVRWERLGSLIR